MEDQLFNFIPLRRVGSSVIAKKSLVNLNSDVFFEILHYLGYKELSSLNATSSILREQVLRYGLLNGRKAVVDVDHNNCTGFMRFLTRLMPFCEELVLLNGSSEGSLNRMCDILVKASSVWSSTLRCISKEGEGFNTVNEKAARALSIHCSHLRRMELDISVLTEHLTIELVRSCSSLRNLILQGGCLSVYCARQIARHAPYIEEIDLSYCTVKDDAIIALAEALGSRLKKLTLMGCYEVGNEAIFALARHCECLESISLNELGRLSDGAIGVLTRSKCGSTLLELDVGSCTGLSDTAFWNIGRMRQLKELACFNVNITGSGLRGLVSLPALRTLDMTNCHLLSDEEMAAILPNAVFTTTLEELELSETDVSTPTVKLVLKKMSALRVLHMSGCPVLSTDIISVISQQQRRRRHEGWTPLEEVDLSYCCMIDMNNKSIAERDSEEIRRLQLSSLSSLRNV